MLEKQNSTLPRPRRDCSALPIPIPLFFIQLEALHPALHFFSIYFNSPFIHLWKLVRVLLVGIFRLPYTFLAPFLCKYPCLMKLTVMHHLLIITHNWKERKTWLVTTDPSTLTLYLTAQVANSRPSGWIRPSTLFYLARHLVSTWWQCQAPCP